MAGPRRIGAADSGTRAALLDAAEQLMLQDGYAAVTSRRVGQRAQVAPQLVHYYFSTMDDLFLEVFRRRADAGLQQFACALDSAVSLRMLWKLRPTPSMAVFNIEFTALANHHKAIRSEIARYANRYRQIQLDAMTRALGAAGISPDVCPPAAAVLAMMGTTQIINLAAALGAGQGQGHDDTISFIGRLITRVEPKSTHAPRPSSDPARRPQRPGGKDSSARTLLLDAAEQVMVEEGYAAVTSRRVGLRAGIAPQLVHYYFRTMDEMFLQVFRRRADAGIEQLARALRSDDSLRTLWESRPAESGAAFRIEFAALANHRDTIRAELVRYANRIQQMQLDAMTRVLARAGISARVCPPVVALMAMTGIALIIDLEEAIGVRESHDETIAFIDRLIMRIEGEPPRSRSRTPLSASGRRKLSPS